MNIFILFDIILWNKNFIIIKLILKYYRFISYYKLNLAFDKKLDYIHKNKLWIFFKNKNMILLLFKKLKKISYSNLFYFIFIFETLKIINWNIIFFLKKKGMHEFAFLNFYKAKLFK